MAETWGPWIEHDGTGCPCRGEFVQVEWLATRSGDKYEAGQRGITQGFMDADRASHPAWRWVSQEGAIFKHPVSGRRGRLDGRFVRYRVRQFQALTDLKAICENPQPVREDA